MDTLKKKLTSRKLWFAVAGIALPVMGYLPAPFAGYSAIAYMIAEGIADGLGARAALSAGKTEGSTLIPELLQAYAKMKAAAGVSSGTTGK